MSSTSEWAATETPDRPIPSGLSYEEFLDWCDEDVHAEWVDGEIIVMSPVSVEHQDIVGFLHTLLRLYVEAKGLGRVWVAPLQMRLAALRRGREPDLVYVSNAHLDRVRPTFIDGPADLAVEVVSPESETRDRDVKLREYEAAGIPEYWLIEPVLRDIIFYRVDVSGRYRPVNPGVHGFLHSAAVPGFRLRLDWLRQRPLPLLADALRELGL